MSLPRIIQGGMGIAVSDWRLARAVSSRGQLGVVSGTALDSVFVRRLQDGDAGGHLRRAMAAFPWPEVVDGVLQQYFLPKGRLPGAPYAMVPMYRQAASRAREALTMLAAFCEVRLAREGHDAPVGINLLTKVQRPNLATLYGAMLAGVGVVLMGAGIPREIPAVLDAFAEHRPAMLKLDVLGGGEPLVATLDPGPFWRRAPWPIARPDFLPIVSSHSLATLLATKTGPGGVQGFVVEGPTAGGHNAPPRGAPQLTAAGEPIYGPRDVPDLEAIRALGLPFWLAGSTGHPDALRDALAQGATGVQLGTLFAYSDESGLRDDLKRSVLRAALRDEVAVFTDPRASPTGYPFKVVRWPDDPARDVARERVCDLGYLRTAYRDERGRVGYRCPAEPVRNYQSKGGDIADTEGRRCLCNALMANVGLAQARDGHDEPPLLTSGDDLAALKGFLRGRDRYGAGDVIAYLLGE